MRKVAAEKGRDAFFFKSMALAWSSTFQWTTTPDCMGTQAVNGSHLVGLLGFSYNVFVCFDLHEGCTLLLESENIEILLNYFLIG